MWPSWPHTVLEVPRSPLDLAGQKYPRELLSLKGLVNGVEILGFLQNLPNYKNDFLPFQQPYYSSTVTDTVTDCTSESGTQKYRSHMVDVLWPNPFSGPAVCAPLHPRKHIIEDKAA